MDREIKFRGKRLNGQWAYGLLCHDPEKGKAYDSEWFISNKAGKPYAFAIAPSTIGQYTGLKDKNGNEIYEGDIIGDNLGNRHIIKYDEQHAGFIAVSITSFLITCLMEKQWIEECEKEVVGNIHENPELIEQ